MSQSLLPRLGLAVCAWAFTSALSAAVANSDCLACHEKAPPDQKAKDEDSNPAIETIRTAVFARSAHGQLQCVECHTTIKDVPHDDKLPAVDCAKCHVPEVRAYAGSIHGMSNAMGVSAAATCASCHGNPHEVISVKDATSPVSKVNLPQTCAACHSDPKLIAAYRMNAHTADYYTDSIHGRALLRKGNLNAPSCNDCHGVHDIKRSVDQSSRTNHANIAVTCGQCHAQIEKTYLASVHGVALAKGNKDAPVCIDCHTAHGIQSAQTIQFKAESDQVCGRCHQDRLANYRDTYHGKAMALARPNQAADVKVAACFDCHGAHDIFPPTDARSLLAPAHIVTTCQQCHPGVGANFTEYRPHADPLDKVHYPLFHYVLFGMTGLLLGVFGFFGAHTALWLWRSGRLYLSDSKAFREAAARTQADPETITRFTSYDRFLHLLVIGSFLLLVLTGMPLKFYYAPWAKRIFALLGGVDHARFLHRVGAVVTFGYFALHLTALARKLWRRRAAVRNPATGRTDLRRILGAVFGPDSLVPSWQDVRDFIAHVKWFLGRGPRPQFDRWTYWEKFDYMAVFWGVFMIGVSGLIMWFPRFFSLFLPGWMINVSLLIHSDEALLAAGFIFTVHFFNTHFRVERFPMDTVIFSGNISKTELMHERQRWYNRLVAAGKLEVRPMPPGWSGRRRFAKIFGFLALAIGIALLILIIYAMLSRLLS